MPLAAGYQWTVLLVLVAVAWTAIAEDTNLDGLDDLDAQLAVAQTALEEAREPDGHEDLTRAGDAAARLFVQRAVAFSRLAMANARVRMRELAALAREVAREQQSAQQAQTQTYAPPEWAHETCMSAEATARLLEGLKGRPDPLAREAADDRPARASRRAHQQLAKTADSMALSVVVFAAPVPLLPRALESAQAGARYKQVRATFRVECTGLEYAVAAAGAGAGPPSTVFVQAVHSVTPVEPWPKELAGVRRSLTEFAVEQLKPAVVQTSLATGVRVSNLVVSIDGYYAFRLGVEVFVRDGPPGSRSPFAAWIGPALSRQALQRL